MADPALACNFTHAITRAPGPEVTGGLRAADTGAPDLDAFLDHHAAYIAALRETGSQVVELPALPAFPDGVFVEDTALCLPEGAVVLRPGAPSRLGEAAQMAPVLARFFPEIRTIGNGFVEGGDLLWTGAEILAGRSARTDAAGIGELARLVAPWGHHVREVETPPGVLHFKTDCSLVGPGMVLATERLAASGPFEGYQVILTAEGEEAAANAIRFNELVLMPAGFPRTAARLAEAGCEVREIPNSEAAKLDGGMSCLSLRFTPPREGCPV
ncbi:MAG: dimethylarginine dimethylaminohydrolase [Paracoccaceae bacterium]|nr:dimethylarginine dimethylaminohydrolase [Paracoccaceae bacterium]